MACYLNNIIKDSLRDTHTISMTRRQKLRERKPVFFYVGVYLYDFIRHLVERNKIFIEKVIMGERTP